MERNFGMEMSEFVRIGTEYETCPQCKRDDLRPYRLKHGSIFHRSNGAKSNTDGNFVSSKVTFYQLNSSEKHEIEQIGKVVG